MNYYSVITVGDISSFTRKDRRNLRKSFKKYSNIFQGFMIYSVNHKDKDIDIIVPGLIPKKEIEMLEGLGYSVSSDYVKSNGKKLLLNLIIAFPFYYIINLIIVIIEKVDAVRRGDEALKSKVYRL
jgi:hypothetical protein